jgi:hypothetical protein
VWNAHALVAFSNAPTAPVPGAGQPPPVGAISMAITQLAVYDAVNSIVGTRQPYIAGLPEAPGWASIDAAVATAAHDVLMGFGRPPVPVLPQAVLDRTAKLYTDTLANIPDGEAKDEGIAAGAAAAAAHLASRDGDGRYMPPVAFTVGTDAGDWRPTSDPPVNDPNGWVRNVTPFALDNSAQFPTNGPPALGSRAYAREYNEVKSLGAVGSVRTPEQQLLTNLYTANPLVMFNATFRTVTEHKGMGVAEEARFYAMVNMAAADSLIACWVEKERWGFWRPVTAIQNGDADGNDRTVGDPTWTPLVASPPYPDHTSGYNCITGGMMHAAQRFFGHPTMDLSVTNLANGATKDYTRFSSVYADTIEARILQGLHFRTADEDGARLGRQVANWIARNFFRPG